MKLLLDEMYPALVAEALRKRGRDAVSVHEVPGRGASDADVLGHARAEARAVVTGNVVDYRPLCSVLLRSGQHHCGLILTTDKRWPRHDVGAVIEALDALCASADEQPVDVELWFELRFAL